jgi:hypothetical protein
MRKSLVPISIILTFFIFCGSQYGHFAHNYTCLVFPDQCDDEKDNSDQSLGKLISEAASFLLQSNSDYQLFLKNFENSSIYRVNFLVLRKIINKAAENIENANLKYLQILEIAKSLDYDPLVLEKLRQFDYKKFQEENNLNPTIFKEVATYLKTGNVIGIYERSFIDTGEIFRRLRFIKANIDSGTIPAIKDCWRINQLFLELELYGMYSSQVLFELE